MLKTRARRTRGRKRRQRGSLLPLAALIPALIAGGKAVPLGAVCGAASYGAKKGLEAAFQKKRRRKRGHGIKRGHVKHRQKFVLGEEQRRQHARGEFDTISYG